MAKRVEKPKVGRQTIELRMLPDETQGAAMARTMLGSEVRHGYTAATYADPLLGEGVERPSLMDSADYVRGQADKIAAGDLEAASRMLTGQAIALDGMFIELARRSTINMGQYVETAERYARLALKAQSNCRATLEALAKIHQPREQTVKHVHINEGGQAVVADHFHHNPGVSEIGKSNEQCDATGAAGDRAALPCPDAERDGLPIPSCEREAAVSYARRHKSGAT